MVYEIDLGSSNISIGGIGIEIYSSTTLIDYIAVARDTKACIHGPPWSSGICWNVTGIVDNEYGRRYTVSLMPNASGYVEIPMLDYFYRIYAKNVTLVIEWWFCNNEDRTGESGTKFKTVFESVKLVGGDIYELVIEPMPDAFVKIPVVIRNIWSESIDVSIYLKGIAYGTLNGSRYLKITLIDSDGKATHVLFYNDTLIINGSTTALQPSEEVLMIIETSPWSSYYSWSKWFNLANLTLVYGSSGRSAFGQRLVTINVRIVPPSNELGERIEALILEDFEIYDVGKEPRPGWIINRGSEFSVAITNGDSLDGSKALNITFDGSTTSTLTMSKNLSAPMDVLLNFGYKLLSGSQQSIEIHLLTDTNNDGRIDKDFVVYRNSSNIALLYLGYPQQTVRHDAIYSSTAVTSIKSGWLTPLVSLCKVFDLDIDTCRSYRIMNITIVARDTSGNGFTLLLDRIALYRIETLAEETNPFASTGATDLGLVKRIENVYTFINELSNASKIYGYINESGVVIYAPYSYGQGDMLVLAIENSTSLAGKAIHVAAILQPMKGIALRGGIAILNGSKILATLEAIKISDQEVCFVLGYPRSDGMWNTTKIKCVDASNASIAMYLSYVPKEWSAKNKPALFVVVGIDSANRTSLDPIAIYNLSSNDIGFASNDIKYIGVVVNASSTGGIRVKTLELYAEP